MVGKNTQTCEMIADNIIKGRKVDDRGVSVKAGQGIRSLREQSFWKSSLLHLFPQETDSDVEIYMQEMYWESMSSENPFQRICGEKEIPHIKVGPEETSHLQYLRFASGSLYPNNKDNQPGHLPDPQVFQLPFSQPHL